MPSGVRVIKPLHGVLWALWISHTIMTVGSQDSRIYWFVKEYQRSCVLMESTPIVVELNECLEGTQVHNFSNKRADWHIWEKKNTHKHVKWKSRILSIFMKGHNMECNFHTMALNYASAISIVSHDHERRLSW